MMGKMRGMRPSYFQDGDLFDLEDATKLPLRTALLALECWSDREGRFEWNPRVLKLNCLPYDKCDFADVLAALDKGNFVKRYTIGGKACGVINPELWSEQNINKKEAQSVLPAPPSETLRLFESGSLAGGFHSYRDEPNSATVRADSNDLSGANLSSDEVTYEVKGSEVNRTEGEEDQKHADVGDVVDLEGVALAASGEPEPETTPPALSLAPIEQIGSLRGKSAPLPAIEGKRTMAAVRDRLAAVAGEIRAGTRARVDREQLRVLQAEMVFGYWVAKTGHEKSIFDPTRERAIVKQLETNGGDVSELLYAVDGSMKDDHLQGRRPDSVRKYDGIETIFRDRAQVERLADLMPKHRAGETHRVVTKYADALNVGGSNAKNGAE
jgi:hypothetical protein